MNITATLNGASVTIVDVTTNGNNIVITYRDASGNLNTTCKYLDPTVQFTNIATSATVVG